MIGWPLFMLFLTIIILAIINPKCPICGEKTCHEHKNCYWR